LEDYSKIIASCTILQKKQKYKAGKIQLNLKLQGKVQELYLIKHHTMKLHGEVAVQNTEFLLYYSR
jgi:hypothetical protein